MPETYLTEGSVMKTSDISVRTNQRYEFVSITGEVQRAVSESGVEEGICVICRPTRPPP